MDSRLEIPALPASHARALQMLGGEQTDIGDLAEVVEGDAGLSGSVLRAANSAASAPVSRITSIHLAIPRIGLRVTREIVLGTVANRAFQRLVDAGMDVEETWSHQLMVAMLCHGEARRRALSVELAESAYILGLLHDVGRLSMASQEPLRYRRVMQLVERQMEPLQAERMIFGLTHAEWGGEVARAWDMDPRLAEAIESHHDEVQEEDAQLAQTLHSARRITRNLGIGDGTRRAPVEVPARTEEDEATLALLGGAEGLFAQLEWYRGAMTLAAA